MKMTETTLRAKQMQIATRQGEIPETVAVSGIFGA